jgi:hypothetical protein
MFKKWFISHIQAEEKWFISHIQAEEKQGEIRSECIGHAAASGAR